MDNSTRSEIVAHQLESHGTFLRRLADAKLDRRLRSRVGPSDIVQECMQRAFSNRAQLGRTDQHTIKCWLVQILNNVLIDNWKLHFCAKRRVTLERSLTDEHDDSSELGNEWIAGGFSLSSAVARKEDSARLAACLARLPDNMREILVERFINGRSVNDVAQLTGRTRASAKSLQQRGLEKLRKYMT